MPGYDHNDIGEWLPPLLIDRGLTVERFANKVGVTKATIYNYMNDIYRPSVETMAKMCHILGVPEEEGMAQYSPREIERHGRVRSLRPSA